MDTKILITVTEIRAAIRSHAEESLQERVKAAMREAMKAWLPLSEDEKFRAAVGAVLLDATPEEKEKLEAEIKVLKALSAAIDGVPVNILAVIHEAHIENPVGLNNLWHEVEEEDKSWRITD